MVFESITIVKLSVFNLQIKPDTYFWLSLIYKEDQQLIVCISAEFVKL